MQQQQQQNSNINGVEVHELVRLAVSIYACTQFAVCGKASKLRSS